ncbi:MAG: hypothetical protein MHPSP_000857 [Paramarteilia canceri]
MLMIIQFLNFRLSKSLGMKFNSNSYLMNLKINENRAEGMAQSYNATKQSLKTINSQMRNVPSLNKMDKIMNKYQDKIDNMEMMGDMMDDMTNQNSDNNFIVDAEMTNEELMAELGMGEFDMAAEAPQEQPQISNSNQPMQQTELPQQNNPQTTNNTESKQKMDLSQFGFL